MSAIVYRDLTTLDDFGTVVELEKRIWGYTNGADVVPVPILAVTVHRGGILVGAFDRGVMVGFVYSIPAIHGGALAHWSHMLGVLPSHRSSGLGRELKLLQRERALALGVDLIEWTFDPLLALNAYLNFVRLGVIADEYEENIYGPSSSALHGGLPTDRLVVQWWIRRPHVERRIAPAASLPIVSQAAADATPINVVRPVGRWLACSDVDLSREGDHLLLQIPPAFLEMLAGAPEVARDWRSQTRDVFTSYLGRGYRVVDFLFDRSTGRGSYLLARRTVHQ
jgi:predicted GNAT superfamily acetyltransferase